MINRILRVFTLAFLFIFLFSATAAAIPSSSFTQNNGEWYDQWNINRNYYAGPEGYLPDLKDEALGENAELAYNLGISLAQENNDRNSLASAILRYVQTWTIYGYDGENVFRDGVAQDEWAWNADETAHSINEDAGVKAVGDCEDLSFLCATIYTAAGFDAAIVDAPGHVACLIWLPQSQNANYYWDISNDDRGKGWIWIEATGKNNPVGWTPPDFNDGDWTAYPVSTLGPVDEEYRQQTIPIEFILIAAAAIVVVLLIVIFLKFRRT